MMFRRNGRRLRIVNRNKEKSTDASTTKSRNDDISAEPPVISRGLAYRATSTVGVANMTIEDGRNKMTEGDELGIKIESEAPSNRMLSQAQSHRQRKTQCSQATPQRIDSTSSSSPTTKQPRIFDHSQDYDDESEAIDTVKTSYNSLSSLQAKGCVVANDRLDVVTADDPRSYDLVLPAPEGADTPSPSLETRSEQIFSKEHLQAIFKDPSQLIKFSAFLGKYQPDAVPMLLYYLDSLKALETIKYSNAVAETLSPIQGYEFTRSSPQKTTNSELEEKARLAFEVLTKDSLPAYVTHSFIQTVSLTITKRVTGTLPPHLRDTSDGLAEVFCLSDPSRKDNPLVLASEEFHRTTQYGVDFAMGRNCRFLQGPGTNRDCTRRIRQTLESGGEVAETFINYRRDGSPFLNLLMVAPLRDNRGTLRYFLGAQVDVSGLAKNCSELEAMKRVPAIKNEESQDQNQVGKGPNERARDSLQELSEMFSAAELTTIKNSGGIMHREVMDESSPSGAKPASGQTRPRVLVKDQSSGDEQGGEQCKQLNRIHGRLQGVYRHYLLVRPYPSLRILFTSPSLRFPGILQSPLMDRIGSSERVRKELLLAMEEGRGVTAKVKWLSLNPSGYCKQPQSDAEILNNSPIGRNRWLHCTPLLSSTGKVGVWMIVLVDEVDSNAGREGVNKFKAAPPVPSQPITTGGFLSSDRQRQEREHLQRLNGVESIGSLNESFSGRVSVGDSSIDSSAYGDFKVI